MIKRWHRNGAVQGLKSRIPFKGALRRLKRHYFPYTPRAGNDEYYLNNALTMARAVRNAGHPMRGVYLEIGAGWTPVMSVVFYIAGYDEVVLCDLDPFLDDEGVARAKSLAATVIDDISAIAGISQEAARQRLSTYHYQYRCPMDLSSIEAQSVDLIVSRAVLEHVPIRELGGLHAGLARALKPGGLAVHLIDHSDHFEHRDKSISRVNFLRFSQRTWSAIEMLTATSQNRLRHSDHARALKQSGLTLLHEDGRPDPGALDALTSLKINAAFVEKTPEDLATLTSLFVLKKTCRA